jgi:hypothetical protein
MEIPNTDSQSRRSFLDQVSALTFALAVPLSPALAAVGGEPVTDSTRREYNLTWLELLRDATDRGLIDTTQASRFGLQVATRYLDNCDAAYGVGKHSARVVINMRTRAVPLGVTDALWRRYALGVESGQADPVTNAPALRNPFLDRPAEMIREEGAIGELVARGAILLVCDLALGHVARSIVSKRGGVFEDVHRELGAGLVPGAFAVPSGIFGAIRAQNAGCGYIGGM